MVVSTWVALLWLLGGTDIASPRFGRRTILAVGRAALGTFTVVVGVFFFLPFFAPRGSTLTAVPVVALATLVWRFAYLRLLSGQTLERRVAIVGVDDAARRTLNAMLRWEGATRYVPVAFVGPERTEDMVSGLPVISLDLDPWSTIRRLDVELLVVGHTKSVPSVLLGELTHCFEHGVQAVPATALYEQLTGRVLASALEADWYAQLPTHTRGLYMGVKRAIDVALSLVLGLAALAISLPIATSILVTSGRPIILRQVRVGLRGHHFVLHKFRTMRLDAESNGPRWASEQDDRVTPLGAVLRRTRLDELPQLWNVLRGDMSLVGPRPERPEFFDQLARELPLYRARTLVRPGITGWAQVQYPYAGTVESNLEKLEYDLYYIRHLGPLLDVAVALRTLSVIFKPRVRRDT